MLGWMLGYPMPRKAKQLSALEVARLDTPGLYAVGGVAGLHLRVRDGDARSWILRVMVGTKRRDLGLGAFPDVPLAAAREKARQAREQIVSGVDPALARREARSALIARQEAAMTFDECAIAYIKSHEAGWRNVKHAEQWRNTLATYASPVIGRMLVADVGTSHVLKVLTHDDLWTTKNETASRLRGRIENILDWARVRGYRSGENPARWRGHLDKLLPKPSKVQRAGNHPALDWREVGAFWSALAGVEGMGAAALRFAILTAARSNEVRGARWNEIDLQAGIWTVPAERMKADREHRVPLSPAAVDLLKALPRIEGSDLLFPAPRGGELSDATLGAVIKRLHEAGIAAGGEGWIDRRQDNRVATPHGIARSTFRTWAAEATNYPREIAEAALAHVIADRTEAAYQRGDALDRRRRLMRDWAKFLAAPSTTATVTPIRGVA